MNPLAAVMMVEGAVAVVEEETAQMDSSAAAMMVEDAVPVAEEGPRQTDSWVAEVMAEVSLVAAEGPMSHQMDHLRGLADSADTREHLFAEMGPLQA